MRRVEGERIEFRITTGEFFRVNLVIFFGFAAFYSLMMLASGWLTDGIMGYRRALDFWDLGLQPALMLLIGLPLVLIITALLAKKRQSTMLTPYGVEHPPLGVGAKRGFVPWQAVVGADVTQAGFVHLIGLRLHDNRTLRIAPPQAFRKRDPRLTHALEVFREHAGHHGGRVDAPVRSFRAGLANVMLVIFCLVAVAGVARLAVTPVITPWAPQAGPLPDACEAVERAGLDKHWSAAQRAPLEPKAEHVHFGAWRGCEAAPSTKAGTESPYSSLSVDIERHDGRLLSSGAKEAYEDVAQQQRIQSTAVPVDIGDLGFRWTAYGGVTVTAAHGDLVVTVEVAASDDDGDGDLKSAGRAAEQLAAGVLQQVRFD